MAHVAAFGPGMYCGKGNEGFDDNNTNAAVQPMRNMTRSDWWLHHFNRCDEFPPPDGEFLVLPSGGEVTLELAVNRAFTTRAIRPNLSDWPHGKSMDPALGQSSDGCWFEPNLHTRSEVEAAGTALAISYATGMSNVKPENLVIFSVAAQCPPSGCTCAWGWVPEGCGAPDIYMQIFKCTVTNYPGSAKVMVPKGVPPVWCEDDPRSCVQGPKQMIYWGQREGNNVFTASNNKDGSQRRPAYNYKMGFMAGAQHDIVKGLSETSPAVSSSTPTPSSTFISASSTPTSSETETETPNPSDSPSPDSSVSNASPAVEASSSGPASSSTLFSRDILA